MQCYSNANAAQPLEEVGSWDTRPLSNGVPLCGPDELASLARAASAGDPEALSMLVVSMGSGMLKTVRKVLGATHPDVEDVTQDALLALLSGLSRFRGECTIAHFAHRVALHTALAARRRFRTRDRWTEPEIAPESVADERCASPLTRAIGNRRRSLVRKRFNELSEPIAEALALHFMVGYTVEEIAATVSVSTNTVWSRLRLGKQTLRRKIGRDVRLLELLPSTD